MDKKSNIVVFGASGLVGSNLVKELKEQGYSNIDAPSHYDLDLTNQKKVHEYLWRQQRINASNNPCVFMCAGLVGGISANSHKQADFLSRNLSMASNVIDSCHNHKITKLLYLGSSCVYPRISNRLIVESDLLGGHLEPSNEGYAIAKIAGLKLCEMYNRQYGDRFISAMITNIYGPGDNFDLESSHVIAGMMHRFHLAKVSGAATVEVWGDGTPTREFLYVEDLSRALIVLMQEYEEQKTINVGSETLVSIEYLAKMMSKIVGFKGDLVFNKTKPNGTPQKIMDSERIRKMGWQAQVTLQEGLTRTYASQFLKY